MWKWRWRASPALLFPASGEKESKGANHVSFVPESGWPLPLENAECGMRNGEGEMADDKCRMADGKCRDETGQPRFLCARKWMAPSAALPRPNGCAAAIGEETVDLSAGIARFCDILK